MATGIQYKTQTRIISGGYPGEIIGTNGSVTEWTEAPLTGSATVQYWYHDSDSTDNNNSSRVTLTVTDSWSISVENRIATVAINTTIEGLERTIYAGSPGSVGRDIRIYDREGGNLLLYADNTPVATAGSIQLYKAGSGDAITYPYALDSRTFVLDPIGENPGVGTIYFWSHYVGGSETEELYNDKMYMGMGFRNILPPDYRPGKIFNSSDGQWYSHNRNGGAAKIYTGSNWLEMRTVDGAEASGNPPEIYHSPSNKLNMRLIGKDA